MDTIPIRHIQAAQQKTPFSEGFSIRNVRDLLAGKDMVQELHRHDFFYVLALKKGKGQHAIDFVPYEVGDHTVFILRPGQVHQLTLKAGSSGYLLAFNTDLYSPSDKAYHDSLHRASHVNHYRPDADPFSKLYAVLTAVFQEYTDQQEGYETVIRANLSIFFIELGRQQPARASTLPNSYAQERYEAFSFLLQQHISTHKQASQYAALLHLSLYQLNAITKSMAGKTCSELITEYIVLEAKRYLLATANQVNQIADQLGYEDASYFIRFFKKHTGHSPEAFRQYSS